MNCVCNKCALKLDCTHVAVSLKCFDMWNSRSVSLAGMFLYVRLS